MVREVEQPDSAWHRCVDRLYDAVGHEKQLAEALGAFRPFFDAGSLAFLTVPDQNNPRTSHLVSVGVADHLMVEYHAHFHHYDEWLLAARRRADFRLGVIYRGTQLVPLAQLRKSYFWNQFLVRNGVTDTLSAIVEASPSGVPTAFLSLFRHQGKPAYGRAHTRLMATLSPHLRQVLRLHRRLAPALALGSTLRELVERIDLPMLFVAADGRVADRNPAAAAVLDQQPLWLQSRANSLWLRTTEGWAPVRSALDRLAGTGSLALDLVSEDRRCATLELRLVHGAATDQQVEHPVYAVGTLTRGPRDRERALRALYGLTAAEARVAVRIAEGQTPSQIVALTGLSITTVRTHLAAARQKLEVSRQAQIAALVLRM